MGPGGACAKLSVIGAARLVYALVGELRPLLPQGSALAPMRAPKRANLDQPTVPSLASAGGRNLDACACFLGARYRLDRGLSYDVLWAL